MARWDKTIKMKERLGLEDLETELYQGRHIIHRDSPIDGGVYLGGGQREAIVVDSKKYPKLKELYKLAKDKATQRGAGECEVLQAVYDTVAKAMSIQNRDAVKELIHRYGAEKDVKIALDVFLEEGVGFCRHYALACGALLELFKKEGFIKGKISVDRNSTHLGGHAWCRYTNPDGEVFILDVAQKYFGRLEDSVNGGRWDYHRPEDL